MKSGHNATPSSSMEEGNEFLDAIGDGIRTRCAPTEDDEIPEKFRGLLDKLVDLASDNDQPKSDSDTSQLD